MIEKKEARAKECVEWDKGSLPAISAETRRAAYEGIPESMWQEFADWPDVAISVLTQQIIAGGEDPFQLSDLDPRFGVVELDYFIAPSKLFKSPHAGGPRRSVA